MARIRPGLLICCKDYRYIQPIQRFAKRRLALPLYDLKATAGGVRTLLDAPRVVRQWILKDVRLVYRLHGVRRIVIVQHEDCAAYGGSKTFRDPDDEFRFQARQLLSARTYLRRAFPRAAIQLFFVRRRGRKTQFVPVTAPPAL